MGAQGINRTLAEDGVPPAAVRALEERLGEPLPPARPGVDYDELFIICGCPAQCAGISGLSARRLVWVLSTPT